MYGDPFIYENKKIWSTYLKDKTWLIYSKYKNINFYQYDIAVIYSRGTFDRQIRKMRMKEKPYYMIYLQSMKQPTIGNICLPTQRTMLRDASSMQSTAPGPNRVSYTHMKSIDDNSIKNLTEVLEKSLFQGDIPEDWLDSHLCPLPNKSLRCRIQ